MGLGPGAHFPRLLCPGDPLGPGGVGVGPGHPSLVAEELGGARMWACWWQIQPWGCPLTSLSKLPSGRFAHLSPWWLLPRCPEKLVDKQGSLYVVVSLKHLETFLFHMKGTFWEVTHQLICVF